MPAAKRRGAIKPVSKKAKIEEVPKTEYDLKLDIITNALRNEEYPIEGGATNREMLIAGAPCVYEEFIENRHSHQNTMAGFIDQAFMGIRASLNGKCEEQQKIQDCAETRRAELASASEAARLVLAERETTWESCKEALAGKKEILTEARAALKEAKTASKSIDSEIAEGEVAIDKFTRGLEIFKILRDTGAEKALIKEIKPILTDLSLTGKNEECFTILGRDLGARGMFDTMVMNNVLAIFVERIAAGKTLVEEIKTKGADTMQKTADCEARVAECLTVVEGSDATLSESKTALTEAKTGLKEAETAVTQFEKDVASAGDRKIECEKDLSDFAAIEENLIWLKSRTAPIIEPEIIEDDKPIEEAAASGDVDMEAPAAETTAETIEAPIAEETIEVPLMEEAPCMAEPIIEDVPTMDSIIA